MKNALIEFSEQSSEASELNEPRVVCGRCGRPEVVCYCAQLVTLPTRTKVVVLQHPRERHKAIGTARIAALCLPSAQIAVGVDFANDVHVRALLSDPSAPACLLYPSADARDLASDPPKGPVTLVVVDGTWHHAKSLLSRNPWLHALPKVALRPERPSEYRIRREPRADYVSTIEALAQALGLLEGELEGDPARFDALMEPFRAMVDGQLRFASGSTAPRKRRYRRQHADAVSRLPPLLRQPNLLCVMGEANAWAHDRNLGGPPYPHELIHCTAVRLSDDNTDDNQRNEVERDDERFEHVIAPRAPLSPSPTKHARLTEHDLRDGVDLPTLHRDWRAFVHDDDVLCVWGHYALGLMRREGLPLPGRVVDVRKVAGDYLKARPGSAEELVAKLSLPWDACGRGRGGERLGMLVAVTRWLADAAQQAQ